VLGEAPVGHAITRRVRRLARRLASHDAAIPGRNNVTISMLGGGSVPIVSQTEIEPMKTALSLMFALVTTTALTEPPPAPKPPGPGGSCPHGYIASGSFSARRRRVLRTPSRSRATARVRGDGLRRARTACEIDARGRSLRARFVFSVEGPQGALLRSGDFALRISFWDYEKSRVTTAKDADFCRGGLIPA
jgi:hypothetical protein